MLCHYCIHSGSEGSLVCQTSQHVSPVRSIDVNPFQVTMMAQHTQVLSLFINPMGGQIEISKVYKECDFIRFCCLGASLS